MDDVDDAHSDGDAAASNADDGGDADAAVVEELLEQVGGMMPVGGDDVDCGLNEASAEMLSDKSE